MLRLKLILVLITFGIQFELESDPIVTRGLADSKSLGSLPKISRKTLIEDIKSTYMNNNVTAMINRFEKQNSNKV